MSKRDFFVILYHPNGSYLPLVDNDNELLFFETAEGADTAAKSSLLGSEFGWETFEMGQ